MALRVTLSDIVHIAGVLRKTVTRAPTCPKIQTRLSEVVRILAEAADLLGGDRGKAALWFRWQPLAGFDGLTAEELVNQGHAASVVRHLAMLRDGAYASHHRRSCPILAGAGHMRR
jgi:uncharacterized protein (DUF2384 family)